MSCSGPIPDYLCAGWRDRAWAIRKRDGNRCRGCNRGIEADLEVHHRRYGEPGSCGQCVLTGVKDIDLVTVCSRCHEALTDVRRRLRYGNRPIEPSLVAPPAVAERFIKARTGISAEIALRSSPRRTVVRRTAADILGQE